MAANDSYLVIGTNHSPFAITVRKGSFVTNQIGGFSPPIKVAAITADQYGYITISFGSFNNNNNAYVILGPDGSLRSDSGGASFMLNSVQAVLPSTLP